MDGDEYDAYVARKVADPEAGMTAAQRKRRRRKLRQQAAAEAKFLEDETQRQLQGWSGGDDGEEAVAKQKESKAEILVAGSDTVVAEKKSETQKKPKKPKKQKKQKKQQKQKKQTAKGQQESESQRKQKGKKVQGGSGQSGKVGSPSDAGCQGAGSPPDMSLWSNLGLHPALEGSLVRGPWPVPDLESFLSS